MLLNKKPLQLSHRWGMMGLFIAYPTVTMLLQTFDNF
jgi:hypothetical protein